MKRKIAGVLAALMLLGAPMTALAANTNDNTFDATIEVTQTGSTITVKVPDNDAVYGNTNTTLTIPCGDAQEWLSAKVTHTTAAEQNVAVDTDNDTVTFAVTAGGTYTITLSDTKPVIPEEDGNNTPDDNTPGGDTSDDNTGSDSSDFSSSDTTENRVKVKTAKNGSVSVSPKKAAKDEKVTITVKPDKGYEVDEVIVLDEDGDKVRVKKQSSAKYTFTMPDSKVEIKVTFKLIEEEAALPFADVDKDDSYYEAVEFVYENGLMVGVGDGTYFAPGTSLSRAMVARMLHTLEGKPAAVGAGFTDVAQNFWYTDAINWAAANHIIAGYGNGKFGPDDNITREQLAVILYYYAQSKGHVIELGGALTQPDAASVSYWAADAVQWAVGNGILVENGVGHLAPTDTATRAEVAEAFMAFLNA